MTIEKTLALEEKQVEFIQEYAKYGFHSSDELVAKAIDLLQEELINIQTLEASAALYAEIYEEDEETKEWTNSATQDWN